MIVVDTTVWVDHLNDDQTPQVIWLREAIGVHRAPVLVGDLILCEVLQGLSSEREAQLVERALRHFPLAPMVDPAITVRSAELYRLLRRRGVTVRKTIDMLIGTFCLEHGHALLHSDRDFDHLERYFGLNVVHP